MHEEVTVPELTDVIARLAALLGPREGGVLPLDGGITNRNYRVHFGGDDYVVRLPGKDTNLLGIDREAERLATKRAAELGIGPKVAAMFEEPPCLRARERPTCWSGSATTAWRATPGGSPTRRCSTRAAESSATSRSRGWPRTASRS
jgi:hypothetical protein